MERKRIEVSDVYRRIYDRYAAGVAYIAVKNVQGDHNMGSAFHVGDGVFVTARHVVEGKTIMEVGTTASQREYYSTDETEKNGMVSLEFKYSPSITNKFEGPYYHPDPNIDVALLVVKDMPAPELKLGDHLDDWLGNELILRDAIVMGYPPIPFSKSPLLITAKCEINAIVDKYTGGHPHFIMSTMARGGFSGGPAITDDGLVLGLITESLLENHKPIELGYLAVLSVEAIFNCLAHHRLVPESIDKEWDGFWNEERINFKNPRSIGYDTSLSIYRGKKQFYFIVHSDQKSILDKSIELIRHNHPQFTTVNIHERMIKIIFNEGSIDNLKIDQFKEQLIQIILDSGDTLVN